MMILGKVICTVAGFFIAKIPGVAIGFMIGFLLDYGWDLFFGKDKREKIQHIFFTTTFSVMGYIAKSGDAKMQPNHDQLRDMMNDLGLNPEMQQRAFQYYEDGRKDDFNLDAALSDFKKVVRFNKPLLKIFLEIQLQAAYVQGVLLDAKRALLVYTSERLGIDRTLFARLNTMHQAEDRFREYLRRHYYEQFQKMRNTSQALDAYKVLGIESDASDAEVKRAYRKLISEHHPDKLIAQGLPEGMIKVATEKTQEIKAAYDAIEEARGGLAPPGLVDA